MALARVVGLDVDPNIILIDKVVGIKERLFRIYQGFVGSPDGLRRWILEDSLEGMESVESIFSSTESGSTPPFSVRPGDLVSLSHKIAICQSDRLAGCATGGG